jgi:hypothetical protein
MLIKGGECSGPEGYIQVLLQENLEEYMKKTRSTQLS